MVTHLPFETEISPSAEPSTISVNRTAQALPFGLRILHVPQSIPKLFCNQPKNKNYIHIPLSLGWCVFVWGEF
jgi:hypothetical protein